MANMANITNLKNGEFYIWKIKMNNGDVFYYQSKSIQSIDLFDKITHSTYLTSDIKPILLDTKKIEHFEHCQTNILFTYNISSFTYLGRFSIYNACIHNVCS